MAAIPDPDLAARCRGLSKYYGAEPTPVAALRGVDLDIFKGELLMLVGPSGSGKTTLISILAAILDADEGRCEVLGSEPGRMSDGERVRFRGRRIGFVFQTFNLLPALSARENVAVPLLLNGNSRAMALEQATRLLQAVGLGARVNDLPAHLSVGQQQRVAVARALIHDPELILCDEPTSNLDHAAGREVMSLLRDLARTPGRSIVVVTHDPRILSFADRLAHIDDGRIVAVTSRGEEGPELI